MEYIIISLLVLNLIFVIILLTKKTSSGSDGLGKLIREENSLNRQENSRLLSQNNNEIATKISNFENNLITRLENATRSQLNQLSEITKNNNIVVQNLNQTIENKLEMLQKSNESKLEAMRLTVDEKLHKTLELRLNESFKTVSERLELVHKGLGEMQNLAKGVGDLKRVMTNVKTRGILGELQLSNILDQILTPAQYDTNIATKPDSRDVVEFAVKLPGKNDNMPVYIPIDSKFPLEPYKRLLDAYDTGDAATISIASKEIEGAIKKAAKDIKDKYIYPPATTDFGVMFLPMEGLYAEVVRNTALFESLQNEYKVLIAGPSTLSALLTSLQMGFKTLAIEKRAADVWNILSTVKTEFVKFTDVLENAQKKINQAGDEVDKLVGARTKKIMIQLDKLSE